MRLRVRVCLVAAAAALLIVPASAQRRSGSYVPNGGAAVPWQLNEHHTLVWNGEPYLPVGVRIDGSPQAVQAAAAAGIQDVIVDLPANGSGWVDTLAALEAAKMRYLIRIGSLAPTARGYAVEPQSFRIAGITKPRTVTVDLPGAEGAFAVLASRRDTSIASSGPAQMVQNKAVYDAKPGGEIEHVLLLYPETVSLEQPDFWERLDDHRDTLLATLKRAKLGAGFRGVVNPMGRTMGLPGKDLRFVPTSPTFRMEFRELLERKHRSVRTAMQSWQMGSNSYTTFEELARLVPLWRGTRGVPLLLDPVTNQTVTCNRNGSIWQDITEAVSAAGARRFQNFVESIRSIADVPVIQEWSGWAAAYENPAPALDGVGMRASGTTPSALSASASRASSTVFRWTTPGWLPATDIELGTAAEANAQLPAVLDDLASLGARGFFVRTDSPELVKLVATEAKRRAEDKSLASSSPRPIFFPENAFNPANIQKLPGNAWWLPAPSDGNRIDLGTGFYAYRMRQRGLGDALALWSRVPGRYKLRMVNTKDVVFSTLDGSDVNARTVKGGIEVDLTESPVLITGTSEIPVPEAAYQETLTKFDALLKRAVAERRDTSEERIPFREAVNGFDRSPGGNFSMMQTLTQRLNQRLSTNTWLEAERTEVTNFSEAANQGGTSGNQTLVLRTPLPSPEGEAYYAQYRFPVRTVAEQTVWVAARIPREWRDQIRLRIADQPLVLSGEPVGVYGDGFGWYRVGTTKLGGGTATLRIEVSGRGGFDLAIDAILLTPGGFIPNGVQVPDA